MLLGHFQCGILQQLLQKAVVVVAAAAVAAEDFVAKSCSVEKKIGQPVAAKRIVVEPSASLAVVAFAVDTQLVAALLVFADLHPRKTRCCSLSLGRLPAD